MYQQDNDIPGEYKAAIFLMSLDEEHYAEVFEQLAEAQQNRVQKVIAGLDGLKESCIEDSLDEYIDKILAPNIEFSGHQLDLFKHHAMTYLGKTTNEDDP